MSKLFISYRRADTGYQPEIIKRTLSKYIDDEIIFYDHDIEEGEDFVQVINDRLEAAQVMLVLMGKDWLDILKERSKLPSATDFVKLESEVLRKINWIVSLVLYLSYLTVQRCQILKNCKKALKRCLG
jgi:hypothetical protein